MSVLLLNQDRSTNYEIRKTLDKTDTRLSVLPNTIILFIGYKHYDVECKRLRAKYFLAKI